MLAVLVSLLAATAVTITCAGRAQASSGYGANFTEVGTLAGPPGTVGATEGESLAVGGRIAVRTWATSPAPITFLYTEPSNGWTSNTPPSARLLDPRGWSLIGLATDGHTVVAVASPIPQTTLTPESIDVFTEPSGGWSATVEPSQEIPMPKAGIAGLAVSGNSLAALLSSAPPKAAFFTYSVRVYTARHGGWSAGAATVVALEHGRALRQTQDTPSIGFVGRDVLLGGVAGGHLIASPDGAALFAPTAHGWSSAAGPVARFVVRSSARETGLFNEPPHGWRGTLSPSAGIPYGDGSHDGGGQVDAISQNGRQILLYRTSASDEGCSSEDSVLSRPAGGWRGTLARPADSTVIYTAGNCLSTAVFPGEFQGNDLIVYAQLNNQPQTVDVFDVSNAPAAIHPQAG